MSTAIPDRLKARPKDARGYPVPFVQWCHPATGVPDFRVTDGAKVALVLAKRLCALCGQPMGRHIHFIGGPNCHEHGHFLDPGMHKECALFALQTCPHLARAKGKYNEGALPVAEGAVFEVSPAVAPKVETFALMHTTDYQVVEHPLQGRLIRAKLPWIDVTWWRDGAVVPGPGS